MTFRLGSGKPLTFFYSVSQYKDVLTPHSVPSGKAGRTGPQGVPGAWQWGRHAAPVSLEGAGLQGSCPRLWHTDPDQVGYFSSGTIMQRTFCFVLHC